MNIIYLTQYAVNGQLQSQFFNYAKYINDKEYKVAVYYLFPFKDATTLLEEYKNNSIEVKSLDFSGRRISIRNLIKFIRTFGKLDVDVIHSQHPIAGFYNKIGTTLLNLIYKKKIKIIVEQRCQKQNLSIFAQILEATTHFLANLVICSSESVEKSYFKRNYFLSDFLNTKNSPPKHITFYNSIDLSFVPIGHQLNKSNRNKAFKICTVGRSEPVKQPLLILKAINDLKDEHVSLLNAGSGSLDNDMEAFVNENQLNEKVKLLGNINWVPQLLQESHLYINYSKHEGLSKSLLEAMAIGLPAIVSKVPGNIEVAGENEQYALMGNANSWSDLASIIKELIHNEKLYEEYSSKSLKRAMDFDVKEKIRDIELIYKTISIEHVK